MHDLNIMTSDEIKRAWRKSGESKAVFASMLGLKNRSTLTQLMNGHNRYIKPSKKLSLRIRGLVSNKSVVKPTLLSSLVIPDGTILPGNAEIKKCAGCNSKFISMNSRRKFHSHACQCRAWRKQKKENRK